MTSALKNWNQQSTYYTQTNNPSEEMLRKEDGEGFLESCGPTTAINLMAARGDTIRIKCPGYYEPQPEQVLMSAFHDPTNYPAFRTIRRDIHPAKFFNNRVPQFYPYMINYVFGVDARFEWQNLDNIEGLLDRNIGLMVCLIRPGHYIGIVAYDSLADTVCYRDPWPGNYWPRNLKGTSGFNRWIDRETLENNLAGYRILIGVA